MTAKRYELEKMLAAAGVILSLLFVGYEIRQNTQVARATAIQQTTGQIVEWATAAILDPDWVRIKTYLDTGGSYADLSDEDKTRFSWIVSQTVRIMESRYRQMQMGVIEKEDLGISGGTSNPNWFRSQAFIDWWLSGDREGSWAPDFLEFFETEVLELHDSPS